MIYINKVVVPLQVENSNSQQFPLTLTMLCLRALSTALIVIIFTSSSFGFTVNRIGTPLHPWRSIGSSWLLSPSLRLRSHSADYASITGYPDNADYQDYVEPEQDENAPYMLSLTRALDDAGKKIMDLLRLKRVIFKRKSNQFIRLKKVMPKRKGNQDRAEHNRMIRIIRDGHKRALWTY